MRPHLATVRLRCAQAAWPHPILVILSAVPDCLFHFHVSCHVTLVQLWRVGVCGRENACHGHQLEPFHNERHAQRDILG